MAKSLKTVGMVVGAVALVATGVGAIGVGLGMSAAAASTAAAIGTYASLAAGALSLVSAVAFKPKFSAEGSATSFATNPQSGIPYAIGRTRMSGLRIHADTTDGFSGKTKNDLLGFAVLLSGGGEIDGIEKFTADGEVVTFDGSGNALGRFRDYMAQKVWTGGAMASALALSLGYGAMPGWTAEHKLSGMSHALWMLRFETDGSKYGAGVPEPAWIGRWVKVYDPRLDSTYPGGAGPCRALDEATYIWSRNPALHALTWCLGRWQAGKRTIGIGAPPANIRMADFVEAANIADVNGWGVGGVEWSTDSKWDVLKRMLQAGGAVPTMTGAMIGCRVFAPRISIATITTAHLLDQLTVAVTKPRRDRFNTVIPRYRSEENDWEIISAKPISVPAYVTMDSGVRQKEIDFPLVQAEIGQTGYDGDLQAGQLAAYEIVNSREAGPISFTTGPQFIGLKTGDCVTLHVPEEGLDNQTVILTSVSLDPSTGKISFTAETETASKHAFALGQSATPPLAYALTPTDLTPPTPTVDAWTLTAALDENGLPYLAVHGDMTDMSISSVLVQYRRTDAADWRDAGTLIISSADVRYNITGVDGGAEYLVRIAYRTSAALGDWQELGPVIVPNSAMIDIHADLQQLADDMTAAQSTIDDLTSDAAELRSDIVAAGGEISNLYSITSTQGASIATNATAISNAVGDLADLTVTVSAQGTSITTAQTAISGLELNVATIETDLATQGATVSAHAAAISDLENEIATLELRAATSSNILSNSTFENGTAEWEGVNGPFSASPNNEWGWGPFAYCSSDMADNQWRFLWRDVPVAANVPYTLSADHAFFFSGVGRFYVQIDYLDASKNVISSGYGPDHHFATDFDPEDQKRFATALTLTAPAGAVYARIYLVFHKTSGTVTTTGIRRVKFERGTEATAYSQEASIAFQMQSINANFARAALTLGVGGRLTGWEIASNGQTGAFDVHADYFSVTKPGGGARTEFSDGNWRVYDSAGTLRARWGVW